MGLPFRGFNSHSRPIWFLWIWQCRFDLAQSLKAARTHILTVLVLFGGMRSHFFTFHRFLRAQSTV